MRYRNKIVYLLIGILFLFNHLIQAQEFVAGDIITIQVDDYALIETNHAPVLLTLSSSVVGVPVTEVSNSDMFLKLSSITPNWDRRKIYAKISSGTIPAGTTLKLHTAECTTTNSGGRLGWANTTIYLSNTDQMIAGGIKTCYTGTGYNDGYQLTYTWIPTTVAANYDLIKSTSSPVNITVVYTLSEYF